MLTLYLSKHKNQQMLTILISFLVMVLWYCLLGHILLRLCNFFARYYVNTIFFFFFDYFVILICFFLTLHHIPWFPDLIILILFKNTKHYYTVVFTETPLSVKNLETNSSSLLVPFSTFYINGDVNKTMK